MPLRLTGGPYCVDLSPEIGGAVSGAWFEANDRRVDVLRAAAANLSDPSQAGCFPMAPFCNRLRDSRLDFEGRTIHLAPNRNQEPYPLHGSAWLAPWRIQTVKQDYADIVFNHEPGEWPWRFSATQNFKVTSSGIEITLSVRNTGRTSMPVGLGLHPYFPSTDDVKIRTKVSAAMLTDDQSLATGALVPADQNFDLSDRAIAKSGLDHGFTDWSGCMDIDYGGHCLKMTASKNAKWLQIYAPKGQGYFCAEPVTQANDAFASPQSAWTASGIKVLEPGESETLSLVLQCQIR